MSLKPAVGLGSQNTFLTYDPYHIAGLCCEFQLSKVKTVGGDAFQRPKSASKIYLSMDDKRPELLSKQF